MNRFLSTLSVLLFSTLFIVLFGDYSVSASHSYSSPLLTQDLFLQLRGKTEEEKVTTTLVTKLINQYDKIQGSSSSNYLDKEVFHSEINRALKDGAWGKFQHNYKDLTRNYTYKTGVFVYQLSRDCDNKIFAIDNSAYRPTSDTYQIVAGKREPDCAFRMVYIMAESGSSVPQGKTYYYSAGYQVDLSYNSITQLSESSFSILLLNMEYTFLNNDIADSFGEVPKQFTTREVIRPNFKLSVSGKDIQVEHIKEYDRLPDYPDDEPKVKFYVWTCPTRVTNRDFNPGSPGVEKVFGFVKLLSDPVVDVANSVVEAFSPDSATFQKIPEVQRDRILWCDGSEIIRSELGHQGQNFKFTVEQHAYYVVSLEYVFERVHKYDSQITPDYRYIITPPLTEHYQFLDTSYVFDLDGRTFSTDTLSADCRYGFCDLPPAEKDCSYEQQGSWYKVITCHTDNVFTRFLNFFKWLFVPDGLSIRNSFDSTLDNMNSSFGFLALPFTFVGNLFRSVVDLGSVGSTCASPPLSIFGATASIELCKWRHQLPAAWAFMQTVIQAGIAIAFLWVCYRLLMNFFGVTVDDHEESDETEEVRWLDERTGETGDWERRRK